MQKTSSLKQPQIWDSQNKAKRLQPIKIYY